MAIGLLTSQEPQTVRRDVPGTGFPLFIIDSNLYRMPAFIRSTGKQIKLQAGIEILFVLFGLGISVVCCTGVVIKSPGGFVIRRQKSIVSHVLFKCVLIDVIVVICQYGIVLGRGKWTFQDLQVTRVRHSRE